MKMLNVALPKGRLGEKVYEMFEKAGFPCPSIKENNRKLIFENKEAGVRYFWVKPSDVAIYVERGAADIGVAGKDILLEYSPDVYELLDLKIGKCRMAVAAKSDFKDDDSKTLRVATKFSNILELQVVFTPFVHILSFIPIGIPAKSPDISPFSILACTSFAFSKASSVKVVTNASTSFSFSFILSTYALVISVTVSSLFFNFSCNS